MNNITNLPLTISKAISTNFMDAYMRSGLKHKNSSLSEENFILKYR